MDDRLAIPGVPDASQAKGCLRCFPRGPRHKPTQCFADNGVPDANQAKAVCGGESMEKAIDFCFRTGGTAGSVVTTQIATASPLWRPAPSDATALLNAKASAKVLQIFDICNPASIKQLRGTFDAPFCPYRARSPYLSGIGCFNRFLRIVCRHCTIITPII